MVNPPANGTSMVTLNVSILSATGGVALSVVAVRLTSYNLNSGPGSFIYGLSLVVLVLTTAYALFEFVRQGRLAQQQPFLAPGAYKSAFLAAFFLGLISVAITDNGSQSIRFAGLGLSLCLLALLGFVITVLRSPGDKVSSTGAVPGAPVNSYPGPPVPGLVGPVAPTVGPASAVWSPPSPPRPLVDPRLLPPLFQNDPLYRLPQPRSAKFFAVTKGSDIAVASDDACVISEDETLFALCDGASGSRLPRPWAALLGQQWLKLPFQEIDAALLAQWLQEPREHWQKWVQEIWRQEVDQRNSLTGDRPVSPEVLRRTLQIGAASTFLGLILNRGSHTWQTAAIGDTCLFLFRREGPEWRYQISFPLNSSAEFSDRPPLLLSSNGNLAALIPDFHYIEGTYQRGDVLLMATDALAKWLLTQLEQQRTEWNMLLSLNDPHRFADFVEKQRLRNQMKIVDDDTTLVVIPL